MARYKIITPEKTIATIYIRVRITDINYGNHLGNDALVSLIHEARVAWLKQGGFSEMNVGGCGTIMNELLINYLHESYYGDELTFEISIGDHSSSSFEIYYNITTIRNGEKIGIAKAKTGMVCFDYEKKRIAPISDQLKTFLQIV